MHTYSFEKLDVWQEARRLASWIYITTSHFPQDEKFGLVLQLRRAAISIPSNLAEGSARQSGKDQAFFSVIAYSSSIEILNQLIIASDLSFISIETLAEGRLHIEKLTFKISALRRTQLASARKDLTPKLSKP